jgi:hypothetical protein
MVFMQKRWDGMHESDAGVDAGGEAE